MAARTALLALVLLAVGCGDDDLAALDAELIGNGADPAATSALEDPILVDPELVQQAHPDSARPPESPVQAQYPPGSAVPAADGVAPCGAPFQRGAIWSTRLPADFPLYPDARLIEAAGTVAPDCNLRVVTFTTADGWERVISFYERAARNAGLSPQRAQRGDDQILGAIDSRGVRALYLSSLRASRAAKAL